MADEADAEFEALWLLFEQRSDRLVLNWKLRVRLQHVVELGFGKLEQLGLERPRFRTRDHSRTQEFSDGLNYPGCEDQDFEWSPNGDCGALLTVVGCKGLEPSRRPSEMTAPLSPRVLHHAVP